MKIAVSAATGQLGQLVIQQLLSRSSKAQIVALVRSPEKAQALLEQGITVRAFDYNQPAEQLAEALTDISHLLLISSDHIGQRITQHQHVIAAAQIAQVQLLAYTSLLRADSSPLALAAEHLATEQLIQASGLNYVLLRNNWYSENYAMTLPQAAEHGVIVGATQHGAISSASRLDYATAAAVVLTTSGHENASYELAGDHSYRLDEVAQWTSQLCGKNVVYQDLSEAEYRAHLIDVGLPEGFASILADADAGVARQAMYSQSDDLSRLIGRPTTPMHSTIQQFFKP
jgi:NAD(P)H dehydrogenase (quinone)